MEENQRIAERLREAAALLNPQGKAWLPVLHARRDEWHFTALFSNTARARQLGRTSSDAHVTGWSFISTTATTAKGNARW